MLRLPGASVVDVSFGTEGVIVTVRLRRRRGVGPAVGRSAAASMTGTSSAGATSTWARIVCVIEGELRRLWCRVCGGRPEAGVGARAGSPSTRDFEDLVAWLAKQMAKKPIAATTRCSSLAAGPLDVGDLDAASPRSGTGDGGACVIALDGQITPVSSTYAAGAV